MRLNTWQIKNTKSDKKYKTSLGSTDFDIPMFGYKSSFFIMIVTILSLFMVPWVCNIIGIDYKLPTVIICGVISGFSVSYSQFFIERNVGICKNFWIIGLLLSFLVCILLFLVIYLGILM